MAFQFSADALEFIPTQYSAHVPKKTSAGFRVKRHDGDAIRPKHQQNQVTWSASNLEHGAGSWNVAAPEFKPNFINEGGRPVTHHTTQQRNFGKKTQKASKDRRPVRQDKSISVHRINDETLTIEQEESPNRKIERKIHNQPKAQVTKKDLAEGKPHDDNSKKKQAPQTRPSRDVRPMMSEVRERVAKQTDSSVEGTEVPAEYQKRFRRQAWDANSTNRQRAVGSREENGEAYPRLIGSSQGAAPTTSAFVGKSWSRVVQSEPVGRVASRPDLDKSNEKRSKALVEKRAEGLHEDQISGKNSRKVRYKNLGQFDTEPRSKYFNKKGSLQQNCFQKGSLSESQKKRSMYGSNVSSDQPSPWSYEGDLQWRQDAANSRREVGAGAHQKGRNYSSTRSVSGPMTSLHRSTCITDRYRFKNVTLEFSKKVKSKLFSNGNGEGGANCKAGNDNGRKYRDWYGPFVVESFMQNSHGPKKFGGVARTQGNGVTDRCKGLSVRGELTQKDGMDAVGSHHLVEGGNDKLGTEDDNDVKEGVSNDGVDDGNGSGWAYVETKSKLRKKRKDMFMEKQQNDNPDKKEPSKKILSKNETDPNRSGRPVTDMHGYQKNGEPVKTEEKVKHNRSKSESSNKKKKKKKKKAKEKEKPLYDNDQNKIREFKMRQMIEENLKMNLVELSKTRHVIETEAEEAAVGEWPSIGSVVTTASKILSFSEALKRQNPAKSVPARATSSKAPSILKVDMSKLTEEEKVELRRKKLKEKHKQKKKEMKERKRDGKKDNLVEERSEKAPVKLDLGSVFDRLLQATGKETSAKKAPSRAAKTVVFSSGVISVVSGVAKKNKPDGSRAHSTEGKLSGNALDSTKPMKMSGKERETPKRRRPTMLKKIILRAREAKRIAREAKDNIMEAQQCNVPKENVSANPEEGNVDKTDDGKKENASKTRPDNDGASLLSLEAAKPSSNEGNKGSNGDHNFEPLTQLPQSVISKLHTRKFREYCDHLLSKEIDEIVYRILKDLQRFQTRAYNENPIKAKAKRRLILGIREVAKHAKMGRLKCVIIAPNLEKISVEGGIDFYLSKIIFNCKQFSVPTIYSMSRQALGQILKREVPISAIGIFNYAGVEEDFKKLCSLVEQQREKYKEKVYHVIFQQSQSQVDIQTQEERGSRRDHTREQNTTMNPSAPSYFPRGYIH